MGEPAEGPEEVAAAEEEAKADWEGAEVAKAALVAKAVASVEMEVDLGEVDTASGCLVENLVEVLEAGSAEVGSAEEDLGAD